MGVERKKKEGKKKAAWLPARSTSLSRNTVSLFFSVMILPQVHLRKPCYDFYFL